MVVGAEEDSPDPTRVLTLEDRAAWKEALSRPRPMLAHLNADTTWLLQLPIPASVSASSRSKAKSRAPRRLRFNILIDPWLQGPQSDVAALVSTQWHVVAPTVTTMVQLNEILADLEQDPAPKPPKSDAADDDGPATWYIDVVAISHEFTDHCHQATLLELPKSIPVFATEKAADLVRSWNHFDKVINAPGFSTATADWREALTDKTEMVPPWLGIGRLITEGNALYYHSALIIVFDLMYSPCRRNTRSKDGAIENRPEAVIYSPHGIKSRDLECVKTAGIKTLALLHGLHDVRIWMTAQLNLGALDGIQAARASGAKYWIATHGEAKRGGGFISWMLQRTTYSLRDAVEAEKLKVPVDNGRDDYVFVELGSGDGLVLS